MSTTVRHEGDLIATECPSWCTLPPGHEVDGIHADGRRSRGHAGPLFGELVAVGSIEFADAPGIQSRDVHVSADVEEQITTAADAVDLARDLIRAARWMDGPAESWAPAQDDVDALRGLLDLMSSFSSNDQRARYLLSSDWMRGRS